MSSGANITYVNAVCNGNFIPSLTDPKASDKLVLDGLVSFFKLFVEDLEREAKKNDPNDRLPLWAWQVI
jgi:hypothetical protein